MRYLILFLLLVTVPAFGQQRFENFAALRLQPGTSGSWWALVRYGVTSGDKMGGIFIWVPGLTSADDSKRIIGSFTDGRYVKSEPLTQARGVYVIASVPSGQMTLTIPHGLSAAPANVQYSFQYSTPLSLGSSWTSDGTNIYIKINTLAILTNLNVAWLAYLD